MQSFVKCPACGLKSLSTVASCRRCFATLTGLPTITATSSKADVYFEHTAPDGDGHVGALKLIGIICGIGGLLLAVFFFAHANAEAGIAVALMAITNCSLLFVIAIIAENLVAIRKNTAHLAGIRANTTKDI